MTTTISVRLSKQKKRRIYEQAKPNVNAWVNAVLDRALEQQIQADWKSHFEWLHKHGRVIKGNPEDELRRLNR